MDLKGNLFTKKNMFRKFGIAIALTDLQEIGADSFMLITVSTTD